MESIWITGMGLITALETPLECCRKPAFDETWNRMSSHASGDDSPVKVAGKEFGRFF